ncbi:MAG: hypothetical protein QW405_02595, partial [Fervidicoccaceae archaeon]
AVVGQGEVGAVLESPEAQLLAHLEEAAGLRPVAEANPLSHAADLCREALLYGNSVALTSLLAEALILAAFSGALLLGGLLVARRALETVE